MVGQRWAGDSHQVVEVGVGETVAGLVLRLWRTGSITGVVVDDAGEPAVGVTVTALGPTVTGGLERLEFVRRDTSDDLGRFRLAGLTPGVYVVAVPSGAARLAGGGIQTEHAGQTMYLPGVNSPDAASRVYVGPAEESSGHVIRLEEVSGRAAELVGQVAGTTAPLDVVVGRVSDSGVTSEFDEVIVRTAANGSFVVRGLAMGTYRLRAQRVRIEGNAPAAGFLAGGRLTLTGPARMVQEPGLVANVAGSEWADATVSVDQPGRIGVTLTLREGHRVRGRVVFDGERPVEASGRSAALMVPMPADAAPIVHFVPGGIQADGSFETMPLPSGRYWLEPFPRPRGWQIAGVAVAGRDVGPDGLSVADEDVERVEVVLTNRLGAIEGGVEGGSGSGAAVYIFTPEERTWLGMPNQSYHPREVRPTYRGRYVIDGLLPGEYRLIATEGGQWYDWRRPEVLRSLIGRATPVVIARGERRTVTLRIVAGHREVR